MSWVDWRGLLWPLVGLVAQYSLSSQVVPSVALFVFCMTSIAGNIPLLVPLIRGVLQSRYFDSPVLVSFDAEGTETTENTKWSVEIVDTAALRWALCAVIVGCYVISGLLYLVISWNLIGSVSRR